MRIKDLKEGDIVRCFGKTDSYLVTVQRVVTDMTHYRDIAYVENECGRQGTLTDNDEWISCGTSVSCGKGVSQKQRENDSEGVKKLYKKLKRKQEVSRKAYDMGGIKRDVRTPEVEPTDRLELEQYEREDRSPRFNPINWLKLEQNKQEDIVNNPNHYTYGDIEVIDFIDQVTAQYPAGLGFEIGSALKYLARAEHKNGKEDIEKARFYVQRVFDKWDETHDMKEDYENKTEVK